jgi:hypothetical protein
MKVGCSAIAAIIFASSSIYAESLEQRSSVPTTKKEIQSLIEKAMDSAWFLAENVQTDQ